MGFVYAVGFLLLLAAAVAAFVRGLDRWPVWGTMVAIAVAVAAFVGMMVSFGIGIEGHNCRVTALETGMPTKHVPLTGCFVTLPDGKVVPLDRWIENRDAQ